MNLRRIEQPKHKLVSTLTGQFSFTKDGKQFDNIPFFVRCEPRPERANAEFEAIKDRRNDAANDQLTDAYIRLRANGCVNIHYVGTKPDPFV